LEGAPADAILLAEDFKADSAFTELGGLAYLVDLVDRAPPRSYIAKYAALVVGAVKARQAIGLRPDRQSEIQHISGALSILVGLAVAYPSTRPRGPISVRDMVEAEIAIKRLPPTTRSAHRICDDPVGEATDPPIRRLGERLNELGGCELMAEVAETVAALEPAKEAHRMSTMSTAWDGVGFWAT
jgi:hypothetical protein